MVEQAEYERALGAYLVNFNKLEVKLSEVHFSALFRLGLQHLFRSEARLVERLVPLEIALVALKWPALDYALLRAINSRRNDLAHGHLHTYPNTGELLLEGTHKIKRSAETGEHAVMLGRDSRTELPSLAAFEREASAILTVNLTLDRCLAYFWFGDGPAAAPQHSS